MDSATFRLASSVVLRIDGDRGAVSHFVREYEPCAVAKDGPLDVEVTFGRGAAALDSGSAVEGGHKTVRWRVALGAPHDVPLVATISLGGWPASFALSLVQGYFVEPLISIAAVRRGLVLLPSVAIVADEGLLLIMGRSRAGKSTLAARAMAAGRSVPGDDQAFVDPAGRCWPFPRRLRFYPYIAETAPAAHARLGRATRRELAVRRSVATLTRGYVRPSLAVDGTELGGTWHPEPLPIRRIVLVERSSESDVLLVEPADREAAVAWAAELLGEQRARLGRAGGDWFAALDGTWGLERAVLNEGFATSPVERISVPRRWDASTAVDAIARYLRLEG